MEVLAGEPNFEVEHKEGSCVFQFDIRRVYWCSRLQAERDRVIKKFKKGEVLCDAFCGVGPLAVKAAKAGFKVIANDLNIS
jgi:tRNA (guanine37-N1)-methyltransferase